MPAITSIMDIKGVFLSNASSMYNVHAGFIHFHRQQYGHAGWHPFFYHQQYGRQGVSISTVSSMGMQCVSISITSIIDIKDV
jgi:hypothetical protein